MQFTADDKYEQALLSTLVYIQTHLETDVSLEVLAERIGFSAYHFHRIFTEFVGEPVKTYVRRLRLERSAYRLKISQDAILQIALDAGFKSHETFTRAFAGRFGMNPSTFRQYFLQATHERKRRIPASVVNYQAFVNESGFPPNQAAAIQVRFERVRPVLVAFIRHTGPYDNVLEPGSQVDSLWKAIFHWGEIHNLTNADSLLIGIPQDDPSVTAPEKLRFDVGVQVPEFREPTGNIGCQTLSPGLYMVGRHYGSFNHLAETYAYIYDTYILTGQYQLRAAPPFEVYNHTRVNDDLHIHYTDVYMPLESIRRNDQGDE